MKKYIDISIVEDYVRQELNKVRGGADPFAAGKEMAYEEVLMEIAHQQDNALLEEVRNKPQGLDEAAEEYAYNNWASDDYHEGAAEGLPFDAIGHTEKCFKAGAKWMAGQGVTVDGKVIMDFSEPTDIINRRLIAKLGDALLKVEPGEVIVQIRKKVE